MSCQEIQKGVKNQAVFQVILQGIVDWYLQQIVSAKMQAHGP